MATQGRQEDLGLTWQQQSYTSHLSKSHLPALSHTPKGHHFVQALPRRVPSAIILYRHWRKEDHGPLFCKSSVGLQYEKPALALTLMLLTIMSECILLQLFCAMGMYWKPKDYFLSDWGSKFRIKNWHIHCQRSLPLDPSWFGKRDLSWHVLRGLPARFVSLLFSKAPNTLSKGHSTDMHRRCVVVANEK